MKQISTGAGLVALAVGMVATAFVATHRNGSEAFAQGTGGERRIVYANLLTNGAGCFAYRVWSDNAIDLRPLGNFGQDWCSAVGLYVPIFRPMSTLTSCGHPDGWRTVDNGTSGFRPLTDVDMSGETDAGDISQVLLDFNTRSDDLPPPPIDCTINAPQ
jgi:hypothetical protein